MKIREGFIIVAALLFVGGGSEPVMQEQSIEPELTGKPVVIVQKEGTDWTQVVVTTCIGVAGAAVITALAGWMLHGRKGKNP
jgi:hypothetical protein